MKFTYGTGQRPLDGYTIKRGVGKGGFGEVYFAVSDGGKEVALKLLRGDCGVELRGIAHCINLKHTNLVDVYDLKTDGSGNQWVVMEYVSGEPLHVVLDRHQNGLPRELVREWFLALARAVGYLHDHGIVHRDLKPANVFLEDGVIKVGDYGLCKSISSSQRTPQTQSVGTVHYMAPEISTGNYNKQIDIYACGILLYEMCCGKLPFEGESPAEVLMKHLTCTPDLAALPEELQPVVAKALAKDPLKRYTSMAEMAQALDGAMRPSAVAAAPPALPLPLKAAIPPAAVTAALPGMQLPTVRAAPRSTRGLLAELSGSLALAGVLATLSTVFWSAIAQPADWTWPGMTYFLTVATCWAVLVPAKFWPERGVGDGWGRRLTLMVTGATVGILAMWLDGWSLRPDALGLPFRTTGAQPALLAATKHEALTSAAGYISFFALSLGIVRWWRFGERRRKAWFSFFPVLAAGIWGAILMAILHPGNGDAQGSSLAAIVAASAIVQFVSPHDPPPVGLPRRLRYRAA